MQTDSVSVYADTGSICGHMHQLVLSDAFDGLSHTSQTPGPVVLPSLNSPCPFSFNLHNPTALGWWQRGFTILMHVYLYDLLCFTSSCLLLWAWVESELCLLSMCSSRELGFLYKILGPKEF